MYSGLLKRERGRGETMNTQQIECFLSVARHLNFAKAASELCISQPAVSHQINSLENELGVKLFFRTTRSVELTQSGRIFLDDAKSISAITRHALERFSDSGEPGMKSLSIGYSGNVNEAYLSDILSKLIKKYGYFQPFITKVEASQAVSRISEGALDAAFAFAPSDFSDESVKFKPVCSSGFVCLLKKDDPLTFNEKITVSDLAKKRLILCRYGSQLSEAVKIRLILTGGRSPSDIIMCGDSLTAQALVRAGFGTAVLPEVYAPGTDIVEMKKADGIDALTFGVMYRKGGESEIVKDFVKFACDGAKIYL